MKKALLIFILAAVCVAAAHAQDAQRMPAGPGIVGKVTAVGKDSLTVERLAGGPPVTVKIGESTRIMKQRQPVKLEEIKTDDVVFVRGEVKDNRIDEALVVGVVPAEFAQRLSQDGGAAFRNGGGFTREDLGKKFIAGEVKAIRETKLTIARPDGQTQEIEVDENTSFKKDGQSITLPDIKPGDFVRGRGELKENMFVPKELIVGQPQMRILQRGLEGQAQENTQPKASAAQDTKDTKEQKAPPK